jgi:hypothetical protein
MKDFNQDFEFFTNLIKSNTNFAYARYADGEVGIMNGKQIGVGSQAYHIDKWQSPDALTKTGIELLETLNHNESNYYYAISAHSDNIEDYNFLSTKISNPNNITFANLWINSNYQKMKYFYENLEKDIYLICNKNAKKENFPFNVIEVFPFPDNCVEFWDSLGEDYFKDLNEYISQVQNKTFFISCGPISEILIHRLFKNNPNNQYIDVGSSIDEYVHGYQTRPYMNPNSIYANEISYFSE